MHKDIRARRSIGMHFATFAGSEEEAREPVAELITAREKENIPDLDEEGGFGVINVGQTVVVRLQVAQIQSVIDVRVTKEVYLDGVPVESDLGEWESRSDVIRSYGLHRAADQITAV